MLFSLPPEIWMVFAGAGALFLSPVLLIYIAYRLLR
jgi:hypothetical protein